MASSPTFPSDRQRELTPSIAIAARLYFKTPAAAHEIGLTQCVKFEAAKNIEVHVYMYIAIGWILHPGNDCNRKWSADTEAPQQHQIGCLHSAVIAFHLHSNVFFKRYNAFEVSSYCPHMHCYRIHTLFCVCHCFILAIALPQEVPAPILPAVQACRQPLLQMRSPP